MTKDSTSAASSASFSPGSHPFRFPTAASLSTRCIILQCWATKLTACLVVSGLCRLAASSLLTTWRMSRRTRVMWRRRSCFWLARSTGSSGSRSIACSASNAGNLLAVAPQKPARTNIHDQLPVEKGRHSACEWVGVSQYVSRRASERVSDNASMIASLWSAGTCHDLLDVKYSSVSTRRRSRAPGLHEYLAVDELANDVHVISDLSP